MLLGGLNENKKCRLLLDPEHVAPATPIVWEILTGKILKIVNLDIKEWVKPPRSAILKYKP